MVARSYIAPDVTTRVSAVLAAKCLEFYASLMFRKQIPGTEECRIYIEGVVVKKPLTIYGALHSTLFDRRLKVSGWRRAPGSERQGRRWRRNKTQSRSRDAIIQDDPWAARAPTRYCSFCTCSIPFLPFYSAVVSRGIDVKSQIFLSPTFNVTRLR